MKLPFISLASQSDVVVGYSDGAPKIRGASVTPTEKQCGIGRDPIQMSQMMALPATRSSGSERQFPAREYSPANPIRHFDPFGTSSHRSVSARPSPLDRQQTAAAECHALAVSDVSFGPTLARSGPADNHPSRLPDRAIGAKARSAMRRTSAGGKSARSRISRAALPRC